jgi:hypothetical protein
MSKYRVMNPLYPPHKELCPYYSVIPPHTGLCSLLVIGDITLYVGNKLQLCMCKDNIKVGGITLYVGV